MASILADIDDQINAYDNSITERIEKWIKENYTCTGLKISKNPNKDGLYKVSAYNVRVKNKNITSITNGMFEWKEVNNSFSCSRCINIKSLEGGPREVGGDFDCSDCYSLKSLKGSPQEVGGEFHCSYCTSLKTLEGAPEKVGGCFYCCYCNSLESLEGAPEEVGSGFYCSNCSLNIDNKLKGKLIPNCEDCIYNTPYIYIEDIDKQVTPEFVDRVVRVHKKKVLPSIKNVLDKLDKNNFLKEWFEKTQLCNIPIYFDKNRNREKYETEDDATNYLGLYRRYRNKNSREIRLFEDAFINEAQNNEKFLDDLIWKVIIHEYAHAIMDTMYNNIDKLKDQDKVLYKYREESLANAFALRVLEENIGLLSDDFKNILEFVKSQETEYRYGLEIFERDYLYAMMDFWKKVKSDGNNL